MEKMTSLLRLRMSTKDAHYGGNLVDGAHMVHLFGDVATELLIKCDGDEGLFASYSDVQFRDAVRAAMQTAWGVAPVDMGMGGSIPFIAEFAAAFPAATIVVTGPEDPASAAHSVNESLDLGVLARATTAEALFLAALAPGD